MYRYRLNDGWVNWFRFHSVCVHTRFTVIVSFNSLIFAAPQEDTLSELRQVESEAAAYLDQISRYYITRGKLVSKVAKYPHVVSSIWIGTFKNARRRVRCYVDVIPRTTPHWTTPSWMTPHQDNSPLGLLPTKMTMTRTTPFQDNSSPGHLPTLITLHLDISPVGLLPTR